MRFFEEKKLSAKSLIKLAFRAGAAFFWALAGGGRCPRLISRPQMYTGGCRRVFSPAAITFNYRNPESRAQEV
jgi:hypothetical protein